MLLPMFTRQTSLTIKDISFDRIRPTIRICGDKIRRLNFFGKASIIDIQMLDETCPNLESLAITHSQVVIGDQFIQTKSKR